MLNSGTNQLGDIFGTLLYMAQRPGHRENCSGINWRALKQGAGGEGRR